MFHHHHEPDTVASRIDELMVAVFLADDVERTRRIAPHIGPDFVYITPGGVFDGPEGLSEAFSHYRHDAKMLAQLRRTSAVDAHHSYFRYSWERLERGEVADEGWSFGQLDVAGRLERVISFRGLVPAPPS